MSCYIVTFEVAQQSDRAALTERLKAYGTYCPINENCWAIVSAATAAQVRDHLMTAIPATDKIFVIRSGVEAAWRNAYGEQNDKWLKEHL
jgi:hypothetical protein